MESIIKAELAQYHRLQAAYELCGDKELPRDAKKEIEQLRADVSAERHRTQEQVRDKHRILGEYQTEVDRLREEAAQYRQESRTNDGVLFSKLASAYVRQLASKCREMDVLVRTSAELGKEVERLGLLDQIADEGAVRPGWWGRVAARLQERVTELEAENAGLKTKYKRLRDAVNGSLPNDLEYTAALEREVEWLRAKLAAEKKSNPLNAEAHGRNVDDYYKREATSEGMVEFLQLHAELAENDGCPEKAEKLRGVVGEVKRLREELADTLRALQLRLKDSRYTAAEYIAWVVKGTREAAKKGASDDA